MIPEMKWFVDGKCNTSFLNSQTINKKINKKNSIYGENINIYEKLGLSI